jgi:hypothetical protein
MTNEKAAMRVLFLIIIIVVLGFKWIKKDNDGRN